jgi:hypothetical protein
MKRVCPICGKEFDAWANQKYCSLECAREAKKLQNRMYRKIDHGNRWVGWYKAKSEKRMYSEGRMYFVIRREKGLISKEEYARGLKDAVDSLYIMKNKTDIGVRIAMFLRSCLKAWESGVVPEENKRIDQVLRFLDAELLSEEDKEKIVNYLSRGILKKTNLSIILSEVI